MKKAKHAALILSACLLLSGCGGYAADKNGAPIDLYEAERISQEQHDEAAERISTYVNINRLDYELPVVEDQWFSEDERKRVGVSVCFDEYTAAGYLFRLEGNYTAQTANGEIYSDLMLTVYDNNDLYICECAVFTYNFDVNGVSMKVYEAVQDGETYPLVYLGGGEGGHSSKLYTVDKAAGTLVEPFEITSEISPNHYFNGEECMLTDFSSKTSYLLDFSEWKAYQLNLPQVTDAAERLSAFKFVSDADIPVAADLNGRNGCCVFFSADIAGDYAVRLEGEKAVKTTDGEIRADLFISVYSADYTVFYGFVPVKTAYDYANGGTPVNLSGARLLTCEQFLGECPLIAFGYNQEGGVSADEKAVLSFYTVKDGRLTAFSNSREPSTELVLSNERVFDGNTLTDMSDGTRYVFDVDLMKIDRLEPDESYINGPYIAASVNGADGIYAELVLEGGITRPTGANDWYTADKIYIYSDSPDSGTKSTCIISTAAVGRIHRQAVESGIKLYETEADGETRYVIRLDNVYENDGELDRQAAFYSWDESGQLRHLRVTYSGDFDFAKDNVDFPASDSLWALGGALLDFENKRTVTFDFKTMTANVSSRFDVSERLVAAESELNGITAQIVMKGITSPPMEYKPYFSAESVVIKVAADGKTYQKAPANGLVGQLNGNGIHYKALSESLFIYEINVGGETKHVVRLDNYDVETDERYAVFYGWENRQNELKVFTVSGCDGVSFKCVGVEIPTSGSVKSENGRLTDSEYGYALEFDFDKMTVAVIGVGAEA